MGYHQPAPQMWRAKASNSVSQDVRQTWQDGYGWLFIRAIGGSEYVQVLFLPISCVGSCQHDAKVQPPISVEAMYVWRYSARLGPFCFMVLLDSGSSYQVPTATHLTFEAYLHVLLCSHALLVLPYRLHLVLSYQQILPYLAIPKTCLPELKGPFTGNISI